MMCNCEKCRKGEACDEWDSIPSDELIASPATEDPDDGSIDSEYFIYGLEAF